jgi:flagellar FliL protein
VSAVEDLAPHRNLPVAKKPKKGDAPEGDEAAAEEQAAPAAGGGRKKLIIFGAAGLLALAGIGGGGAYFYFAGDDGAPAEAQAAQKPVGFVDIREMVVNLANEPNQERPRLLKFRVALEVKDKSQIAEINPLLPRVEDAFQVFVRELRASDLEGSAGVYRLREELLRRVNIAVYPAKVDAVLFKEIVVQ